MIWEFWQFITTPVVLPYARKMGFLHEAIAMAARARRCHKQWDSHYRNCREAIVQAVEGLTYKRRVVVIGAGSLRDVPLEYLAENFAEVVLVDLAFLKAARKKAAPYANVKLIEHDITESLEAICKGREAVCSPTRWLGERDLDLVVSLNLITQLPLIPVRWLIKHNQISENRADQIGRELIRAHLNYLEKFNCRVCLIADRESVEYQEEGRELERLDPWWEVQAPPAEQSWQWELIPLGEVSAFKYQVNKVGVSIL